MSAVLWQASPPVPQRERPPRPERVATTPPEFERLKSALDAIPNSGNEELSYDEWFEILAGLHHATDGGPVGLELAHEFSARSTKYDPDFLDTRVWPYLRNDRDGAVITERTIFARASGNHGWQDPDVANDFDVVPGEHSESEVGVVGTTRFRVRPAAEFAQGKAPPWWVKDVLPQAEAAMVYGESGSGKTFFVLDLVAAIARGVVWRGKKVKQGRVVYVVAEGAGGFRNRLKAYARHHEIELEHLDIGVISDAPNFTKPIDIKALIASLKLHGRVDVIVVDTLARVTPGANENAGEDMGKVLGYCNAIHRATGALVVLIHHSGKDAAKGARGWSGVKGAMDAEIEIVRAERDRVAIISKQKEGEDGEEFGFKLAQIPVGVDDDGDPVSSCVIEVSAAVAKDKRKAGPKGSNEKAVWQVVMDLQGLDGAHPTTDAVLTEYANRTPRDPQAKRDTRRQHALQAITTLSSRGSIVIDGEHIKLPEGAT